MTAAIFLAALAVLVGAGVGFLLGQARAGRQVTELSNTVVRLETERQMLQPRAGELERLWSERFENLAQRVLETSSSKLRESSGKDLAGLLGPLIGPLREKIQEFEKRVETTYQSESRERFALKEEVKRIIELNQQMSRETSNLTRALKGDSKAQGNWGEIVLERVLERSGLREGEEYVLQGRELGLVDESGRRFRPDVIVNLPDQKHVIVDSKVSLTAYERWVDADRGGDPSVAPGAAQGAAQSAMKAFLASVEAHVAELSAKHYQALEKLASPDFVLMFMPIEAAFSLAVQNDPEIFQRAWDRRIVIVSPTTLLATLRTVASLWKQEHQSRNALEIARQGGALYDKFVGFVGDLERVGKTIGDAQSAYHDALSKLRDGKGNLVSRVESLRKLGAKATKQLPAEHVRADHPVDL